MTVLFNLHVIIFHSSVIISIAKLGRGICGIECEHQWNRMQTIKGREFFVWQNTLGQDILHASRASNP